MTVALPWLAGSEPGPVVVDEMYAPAMLLPPHPANPKSSARIGVRRVSPELRLLIPAPLARAEALTRLADPSKRRRLVDAARVHWQTVDGVQTSSVARFEVPDGVALRPVRKIGGYQGAPNRGGHFAGERDGMAIALPFESRTEFHWLLEFDRHPAVDWMQTQPFMLTWAVGDRAINRTPDILLRTSDGRWVVVDVKPDQHVAASPYTRAVFALTKATLEAAGVGYVVLGEMRRQRQINLLHVSAHRQISGSLQENLAEARRARRATLGGVRDSAGGGNIGTSVALHLLARGLQTDLDEPLSAASQVEWPVA